MYGVDIDDGAVDICKLRLWLSMVADIEDEPNEVEPLPNIDFNIRQGNSLLGQAKIEIEGDDNGDSDLDSWEQKARFEDVQKAIQKHKNTESSGEARKWRQEAEERIEEHRGKFDHILRREFQDAGQDEITVGKIREWEPLHWPLEFANVFAQEGFDVVIGNPPWDQIRPSRDDFFPKYDERFRTRRPSEKDEIQSELLEDDEVAQQWEEYQENIEVQMRYFTDGPKYQLQTPKVAGRKDPNENNIAGLFVERVFDLVKADGYIAQVLPGVIFNGSFSKDMRMKMLNESTITSLVGFENKGIFDGIDDRYNFAVVTFKQDGYTENLKGIFEQHDLSILQNLEQETAKIPREVLEEYSPEARIFPFVSSQQEVDVLTKLLDHPSIQDDVEGTWRIHPHREIHSARDADRFFEQGEYPVYGGRNIHQFIYNSEIPGSAEPAEYWSLAEDDAPDKSAKHRARERAFNSGNLKKAIYTEFGGKQTSKSQKQFVNDLLEQYRGEPLSMDDILLDSSEYRIVFRNITNSTNERTMIASVVPKDVICHDKLITVRPYEISPTEEDLQESPLHGAYNKAFTGWELFVALGLLNSIPFDFIMRTKIDTTVVTYKFNESQIPRLTKGDDWFEYISERAARLNCYGDKFEEMRERLGGLNPITDQEARKRIRVELDAAAFHAYDLEHEDMEFILDDFYQVSNPRLMTEEYFDQVQKKYEQLTENGPLS
ncbi:Eco57I restriction-modification methylase domain-containing protein [Halopenitus salinus]|uniref:Eco57I restriction-modification methylase domain-containing protein n=1 Tax=Halopenitus salinus TaxID=1198295 RepID=UPI00360A4CF6